MSGFIHQLEFKVLIDSEVVDFTFKVPRGTLLIQILDELRTTLSIHPRTIAVVNHAGEIVVIDNQYSTIDFLIQKYGSQYYAGESSIVTFHHGTYIIDLDIPEAIPFAAAYRTACKSFSVTIRDVSIERQDGQVIDYEVFSMPTAFVLNSWGNFYRIVDKDLGDPLVEPVKTLEDGPTITDAPPEPMVYPPQLDEAEIIDMTKKLIETSQKEKSEVDQITDHYVERAFPDEEESPIMEDSDSDIIETETSSDIETESFLTQPIEDKPKEDSTYPWQKPQEVVEEEPDEEIIPVDSIESLMDEVSIKDEIDEYEVEEEALETTGDVEPLVDTSESDASIEQAVVEEVFKDIFATEKQEQILREGSLEEVELDEEVSDEGTIEREFSDIVDDVFDEEEEDEELISYDLPIVEEEDEAFGEEQISDLPFVDEDEVIEPMITDELEQVIEDTTLHEEVVEESSLIERPITESLSDLTPERDEMFSLEERLEVRKKELVSLEKALKAEEKAVEKVSQRAVGVDYYKRMYPQKVFPLTVRIPPAENGESSNLKEVKLLPVFPGCHVTPQEEVVDLSSEKMTIVEFSVTPLARKGKITGRLNLWFNKRNIFKINAPVKVANSFWPKFTGVLAVLFAIFPLVDIFTSLNTIIASRVGLANNYILGTEIGIIGLLLILTVILIVAQRPLKASLNRKFYPFDVEEKQ
ncbi:MAG: hypothetical protein KGD59_06150 [Candidatus Heimdallarchaeota archaeon]|nr:hypothetical protein [Candidatus Heimdallarchaeota archaeon]MBY8994114.1 hypothetical protein [Candidatus Heimdallarchaeota archaeon]